MASPKHISERFPKLNPTLNSSSELSNDIPQDLIGNDKIIYQLIAQNVGFCGQQFGDCLNYNMSVLTDVLYDNIYKLLGDKFQSDDFVTWITDELLSNGFVFKTQDGSTESSETKGNIQKVQEPETVYELDDSAYEELKQKVYASIELIRANKLTIFKLLSDVDNKIRDIGEKKRDDAIINGELLKKRDDEIDRLVSLINGNQEHVEQHIEKHYYIRDILEQQFSDIDKSYESYNNVTEEFKKDVDKIVSKIESKTNNVKSINHEDEVRRIQEVSKTNTSSVDKNKEDIVNSFNTQRVTSIDNFKNIDKKTKIYNNSKRVSTTIILVPDTKTQKQEKTIFNIKNNVYIKNSGLISNKQKLQTTNGTRQLGGINKLVKINDALSKTSKTIAKNRKGVLDNVTSLFKGTQSKTIIEKHEKTNVFEKTYLERFNEKIFRQIYTRITDSAPVKLIRKLVTGFIGVSSIVGKVAVKSGVKLVKATANIAKNAYSSIRDNIKSKKTSLPVNGTPNTKNVTSSMKGKVGGTIAGKALDVVNSSGASFLTAVTIKFGWRAMKFVGKVIWKGIKKLAVKFGSLFSRLFKFIGKAVNTVEYYASRLIKGIKDKTYRFIVKPISKILVSIFSFTKSIIQVPINFIKNVIPNILERVIDILDNIKTATVSVFKSTWSFLKKIVTNPFTIFLIIGAFMFFVVPKILKIVQGGFDPIKKIIPTLVSFTTSVWSIISGAWSVIKVIGGVIVKVIDWITSPSSWFTKTIVFLLKGVLKVKQFIGWLIGSSGRDSVDTLCMWLSGDYIGLALRAIIGGVGKLWNWLKTFKIFKIYIAYLKSVAAFCELMLTFHIKLAKGLWNFAKGLISGKASGKQIVQPFIDWWDRVKKIWSDGDFKNDIAIGDLCEQTSQSSEMLKTNISKMQMSGMTGQKVTTQMDAIASSLGVAGNMSVVQRIKTMQNYIESNNTQVQEYNNFIGKVWDIGKGNSDVSERTIRVMLESPDMSQKLLSALYYYNPQSRQVMSILPDSQITSFLDNLRDYVQNPEITWEDKFKVVIKEFDRLNKLRMFMVNKQNNELSSFVNKINTFDLNRPESANELTNMVKDLNNDVFKNIDVSYIFKSINSNTGVVDNVKGVDDENLGKSKFLTPIKVDGKQFNSTSGSNNNLSKSAFVVDMRRKPDQERDILLPSSMSSIGGKKQVIDLNGKQTTVQSLYQDYLKKREKLISQNYTEEQMEKQGYGLKTYSQFLRGLKSKAKVYTADEQVTEEDKKRRMEGLRLEHDIRAFNNQGSIAKTSGFVLGEKPSILNIETDGLKQTMLIFSPEWMRVKGASNVSESELTRKVYGENSAQMAKINKQKEEEQEKQRQIELQRKREDEILNYSAKVSGGFIEVQVGDYDSMRRAWIIHMEKRQAAQKKGVPFEKLDEMGLGNYTWEEWIPYYRKMNGIPENGIKRIPFEGKRKERNIDMSPRKGLTVDELVQNGLTVSEDGPVMIPIEKAMEISNALIQQANSIYSVRDGLEVMKDGLKTKTEELKKKNNDGMQLAAISIDQSSSASSEVSPEPSNSNSDNV